MAKPLTEEQAARRAGVSRRTLQRWRKARKIPFGIVWRSPKWDRVLYRRAEFVAWLNEPKEDRGK